MTFSKETEINQTIIHLVVTRTKDMYKRTSLFCPAISVEEKKVLKHLLKAGNTN
jgi:hypothetical protein